MKKDKDISILEYVGTYAEGIRSWLLRSWRIGLMLSKGAYLTSERRRLFFKLGEEAYKKMLQGQWKDKELEGLVHQLERINKKVEIEEMLIQSMRFGKKPIRKTSPQSQSPTSLEGQP